MRRLIKLENSLYHKRFREIYKLLFTADLDEISDYSNWFKTKQDYVDKNRPLWIIVESKILNKRIWITQDFGSLEITTARLDLDCKTMAYSESYVRAYFKTQKEMVEHLKMLLEPCLKKETLLSENEEEKVYER